MSHSPIDVGGNASALYAPTALQKKFPLDTELIFLQWVCMFDPKNVIKKLRPCVEMVRYLDFLCVGISCHRYVSL